MIIERTILVTTGPSANGRYDCKFAIDAGADITHGIFLDFGSQARALVAANRSRT
jgi:hypothetical protein